MMDKTHNQNDASDELPPFGGTWRRVYAAVLCYLAVLIAGLYCFTRWFSPVR